MILSLDNTTLVLTIIILVSFVASWIWICIQKKKDLLLVKKHWIDNLPSIISTLGVLGTFIGITKGLLAFNADNLTESIPELLDGLKTAFFTSLAGMIGSLVLTRVVNHAFDDKEKGIADINSATREIVEAVRLLSETLSHQSEIQTQSQTAFYTVVSEKLNEISRITPSIGAIEQKITDISHNLPSIQELQSRANELSNFMSSFPAYFNSINLILSDSLNEVKQHATICSAISNDLDEVLHCSENISSGCNDMLSKISSLESICSDVSRNSAESLTLSDAQANIQQEIFDKVGMFGEILHGEVIEIEDSMDKTNKLLERKFDDFSDLLKKSNTEALVEVMKRVTTEFEKQMNALINKLIQDNFDQLNKSVERLNTWQIENKEMIKALTTQYKDMAESFESTSDVLERVSKSTNSMVGDDSKLRQIVDSLSKVMVEDEQFIQITKNLTAAAKNAKDNSEQTRDLTNSLSMWIQKQRDFADSIKLLMQKLDQINKIRDYGEQFWQGTKQHMEEGVSIIAQGSQTLNEQINILDRQFYNRLNATLSELDVCIQAMIKSKK